MWSDASKLGSHLPYSGCVEGMSSFSLPLDDDVDVDDAWYWEEGEDTDEGN